MTIVEAMPWKDANQGHMGDPMPDSANYTAPRQPSPYSGPPSSAAEPDPRSPTLRDCFAMAALTGLANGQWWRGDCESWLCRAWPAALSGGEAWTPGRWFMEGAAMNNHICEKCRTLAHGLPGHLGRRHVRCTGHTPGRPRLPNGRWVGLGTDQGRALLAEREQRGTLPL